MASSIPAATSNTDIKDYDIFISYNQKSSKAIVTEVARRLRESNFRIWIDQTEINKNERLPAQIERGLRKSKCALCFITIDYCNSEYCLDEFNFINDHKIKYIPVMLQEIPKDVNLNGIGLRISGLNRLYAFRPPSTFDPWSENLYQILVREINKLIPASQPAPVPSPDSE